jgi:ABC-type Zn uptake system ZnuABC Zn-binding protein ZnuA
MKKPIRFAWVWVLLFNCTSTQTPTGKVVVAVSIPPLADFVRQIGGERVEVFTLIPPGASPHTFEITPDQLMKISRARFLILNGIGLEFWAKKVIDNFDAGKLEVVESSADIPVMEDEDHAEGNPHVWLDPVLAMKQVKRIRDAFIKVDSVRAADYIANTARYLVLLQQLDKDIRTEIQGWKNRSFICFHPSWNYFAHRYDLNQAAVIEKRPGFEPTPYEVGEIITAARRLGARAIFAESQFPLKITQVIAKESGVQVLVLDPLGQDTPYYSYEQMIRKNVAEMAKALR